MAIIKIQLETQLLHRLLGIAQQCMPGKNLRRVIPGHLLLGMLNHILQHFARLHLPTRGQQQRVGLSCAGSRGNIQHAGGICTLLTGCLAGRGQALLERTLQLQPMPQRHVPAQRSKRRGQRFLLAHAGSLARLQLIQRQLGRILELLQPHSAGFRNNLLPALRILRIGHILHHHLTALLSGTQQGIGTHGTLGAVNPHALLLLDIMTQHLQQLLLAHLTVEKLVAIHPVKRSHQVAPLLVDDLLHLRQIQLTPGFLVRAGLIQRTRFLNLPEHRGGHQAVSLRSLRVFPCLRTRLDSRIHALTGIRHGGNVARRLLADTLRHEMLHMLTVPLGRSLNHGSLHTAQPGTENHCGRQLLRLEHLLQFGSILAPVILTANISPAQEYVPQPPLQQGLRRGLQRTFLQHAHAHFQRRACIERTQQRVPHRTIPRNLLQQPGRCREPSPTAESNLLHRHRSSRIDKRAPLRRALLQALEIRGILLLIVSFSQSNPRTHIGNKERSRLANHRAQRISRLSKEIRRLRRLITLRLGSIQHTANT